MTGMMLQNKSYFFAVLLFTLLIMTGCGDDLAISANKIAAKSLNSIGKQGVSNKNGSKTFSYMGNEVKTLGISEAHKSMIQEIEMSREDIKYRAIRIDTETYLKTKNLDVDEMKIALEELKDEQLFYFEFEETQKQDLLKKYFNHNMDQSVSYISFDIENDFKIVNGLKDTIQASYSIYERNFHVAPFERVLLGFNEVSSEEEVELIYKDILFKKGEMVFHFPAYNYIINHTQVAL